MSTPATRWGLHAPLDNACVGLEAEDLPPEDSRFERDLESAMEREPVARLERLYPELTFTTHCGSKKPKGADFAARQARGQWVIARWRTAA